jgi:hypothetical protein
VKLTGKGVTLVTDVTLARRLSRVSRLSRAKESLWKMLLARANRYLLSAHTQQIFTKSANKTMKKTPPKKQPATSAEESREVLEAWVDATLKKLNKK